MPVRCRCSEPGETAGACTCCGAVTGQDCLINAEHNRQLYMERKQNCAHICFPHCVCSETQERDLLAQ